MNHVTVGSTGVRVSPLCFGTMSFGVEADEGESALMYRRAREAGINFFDTADVYGRGVSEEILGRLAADHRDDVVLTSKVFYPTGSNFNAQDLSRRHIVRAAEASLRRLGTEWIDFYFVHAFDDHTSIEQTITALDDLCRQGKILYPAVSNWAAWQVATALGVSAREGLARFELVQPMYNLVNAKRRLRSCRSRRRRTWV
ncbi:aldo/keto reductase [Saccharomonospora sp. NPDC046836]|uniref:aldo/keto reductase n=1 Tax=Saccharomonospora sp. NPDC046836 TaxID=3156921 RepID=UPI003403AF1D